MFFGTLATGNKTKSNGIFRFFIEPSIAATFWLVSTNVPESFKAKDGKWNKYFPGEPGLHFGFKF